MNAFTQMLKVLKGMQMPILTVEHLVENVIADEYLETKHIVIHANNGKTTDFVFAQMPHSGEFTLLSVEHLSMKLNEAISYFSTLTLKQDGAIMKLESW